MRTRNGRSLLWLCLVLGTLLPAAGRLAAAESKATPSSGPAMGVLNIEGGAIERVTLAKCIGAGDAYDPRDTFTLQHPGTSVSLPAGKYLPQNVELKGGYRCYVPFQIVDGRTKKVLRGPEWLTISPEKPCLLKVGAPLTPSLRTFRQGRTIRIAYDLLDSEGRSYSPGTRDKPPRFTVSCGGREIASGSFEYG